MVLSEIQARADLKEISYRVNAAEVACNRTDRSLSPDRVTHCDGAARVRVGGDQQKLHRMRSRLSTCNLYTIEGVCPSLY